MTLDSALPRSLPDSQGKNATGEQTHVVEQPHSEDAPTPTTHATHNRDNWEKATIHIVHAWFYHLQSSNVENVV